MVSDHNLTKSDFDPAARTAIQELAKEFKISEQTVLRDINMFRNLMEDLNFIYLLREDSLIISSEGCNFLTEVREARHRGVKGEKAILTELYTRIKLAFFQRSKTIKSFKKQLDNNELTKLELHKELREKEENIDKIYEESRDQSDRVDRLEVALRRSKSRNSLLQEKIETMCKDRDIQEEEIERFRKRNALLDFTLDQELDNTRAVIEKATE